MMDDIVFWPIFFECYHQGNATKLIEVDNAKELFSSVECSDYPVLSHHQFVSSPDYVGNFCCRLIIGDCHRICSISKYFIELLFSFSHKLMRYALRDHHNLSYIKSSG